ncbi:hypothetical protein O9993_19630 [Vibrio lentus]|nr:hypothetical protein [Vibrio lentus]
MDVTCFSPLFPTSHLLAMKKPTFALGSISQEKRNGYYYSYPVSYAAEIIGVIVVKMGFIVD